MDQFEKAEAAFEQALSLLPSTTTTPTAGSSSSSSTADLLNNYALLKLKCGDLAGARALLQRALEQDPLSECAVANRSKLDRTPAAS